MKKPSKISELKLQINQRKSPPPKKRWKLSAEIEARIKVPNSAHLTQMLNSKFSTSFPQKITQYSLFLNMILLWDARNKGPHQQKFSIIPNLGGLNLCAKALLFLQESGEIGGCVRVYKDTKMRV